MNMKLLKTSTGLLLMGLFLVSIAAVFTVVLQQSDLRDSRAELYQTKVKLHGKEKYAELLTAQLAQADDDSHEQQVINSTNLALVEVLQSALNRCGQGITTDEAASICLVLNTSGDIADRANAELGK